MTERELLVELKAAKAAKDEADDRLTECNKRYDAAVLAMHTYMTDNALEKTAEYEGVGHATLMKPRIYASVNKANEEQLKAYLREKGREDLIREVVHPASLSGYVGELIVDKGQTVPEFISYYMKPSVKTY